MTENLWLKIYDAIGEAAAIEMLAEESAELSAAASKLARIVRGENPSRMSRDEAESRLVEEIADVLNALDVLDTGVIERLDKFIDLTAHHIAVRKMKRWYKDLFRMEEEPNE